MKMPRLTEVFVAKEANGDDDWEGSLGVLPGQAMAQQKQQVQQRKDAAGAARKGVIAQRSQASQGGKVPLTKAPPQDPGTAIKGMLSKGPMDRLGILQALHPAVMGDRPFDPNQTMMAINKKDRNFNFDKFLGSVATMGPDKKWKMK